MASLSRSLSAISPLNTLERGYSITFDPESKPVRSVDNVKIGDKIQSRFYKGTIESTVCKIRRKESQD